MPIALFITLHIVDEPLCGRLLNPGDALNPCNGGTCFPVINEKNEEKSICFCPPGFTGKFCQLRNNLIL